MHKRRLKKRRVEGLKDKWFFVDGYTGNGIKRRGRAKQKIASPSKWFYENVEKKCAEWMVEGMNSGITLQEALNLLGMAVEQLAEMKGVDVEKVKEKLNKKVVLRFIDNKQVIIFVDSGFFIELE